MVSPWIVLGLFVFVGITSFAVGYIFGWLAAKWPARTGVVILPPRGRSVLPSQPRGDNP